MEFRLIGIMGKMPTGVQLAFMIRNAMSLIQSAASRTYLLKGGCTSKMETC